MFEGLSQLTTPPPSLVGFGAAGLMGACWLWERHLSRRREQQLDEAHARIDTDRVTVQQLVDVVKSNSEAMTRIANASDRLARAIERMDDDGAPRPERANETGARRR